MEKTYYDRIDEFLFISLFFVNALVFIIFISAMIGIKISKTSVIIVTILLLLLFIIKVRVTQKHVDKLSIVFLGILAIATSFYISLMKYFSVLKWDGAAYLLNAKMFLTQTPILFIHLYRPLTWPAFLSTGLVFDLKEAIPILTVIMFIISTYLLALTLTKNKVVALLSGTLSGLVPVVLVWGLSFYADMYLAVLITLGFASYFHFNNTGHKSFYIASVFLFTLAFLTKFTSGVFLIIPLIEFFRRKLWFSSTVPIVMTLAPYLFFIQQKTNNFFYSFISAYNLAKNHFTYGVHPNSFYLSQMDSLFSWILFILAIIGLIFLVLRLKNKNIFVYVSALILLSVYFLVFVHIKDTRYFLFAVPIITTAAAYMLYVTFDSMSKYLNKPKIKFFLYFSTFLIIILLLSNFQNETVPQYKYTGKDIVQQTADYLKDVDNNIISSSWVKMSWHMQRKVFRAVTFDELSEFIQNNNIKYIVNFEHSGGPLEFQNTSRLLNYGNLVKTFSDGFEIVNIIKVNENVE